MGEVELAYRRQGRFRRLYAVKRMHPYLVEDPEAQQMFFEEARIAGLVSHPNVVSVNDVGEDERGPFLVMDYVDGLSLAATIRMAKKHDRQIPIQVVLRLGIETARGLHAAHTLHDHDGRPLELVHRDVSPSNVLVSWDGAARITDFGVAKALGQTMKTSTGVLKGKVSYMSPEQLKFRKLDHRSDLFSLGVVLYELLTTERLYANDEDNTGIRRILEESPPDVGEVRSGVPSALVALMFALLAKEPEGRPTDGGEVVRRLEAVLAELLREEPAVDVGAWLEGLAGSFRDKRRVALESTLAEAEERELAPLVTRPLGGASSAVITGPRPPQGGMRAGPWVWAGALAAITIVATAAWLAWAPGAPSEEPEEEGRRAVAATEERPPEPAPSFAPEAERQGAASESEEEHGVDEPVVEGAPMRRTSMRRSRRDVGMARGMMQQGTSPLELRQSWESGR